MIKNRLFEKAALPAMGILFSIALLNTSSRAWAANFDRQPDATINTASLFDLPQDVVAAPILKDILTEDFVFYYRDGGADWLSFRGALARLAFERGTDWPTKVLSWILNGPAEVALWKGDDGKLNHFMAGVDQTGIKDFAKTLLEASVQDSQLSDETVDGRHRQKLTLATGREIYLMSQDERLFVFTDAEMKVPDAKTSRTWADRAKSFFGLNDEISLFGPKLGSARHVITISAQLLTFGYQAFADQLKAIRFDFSKDEGWSTHVLASTDLKPVDHKTWALMPKGAALCLTAPINLEKVAKIVNGPWLGHSSGTVATCWYPTSKMYTPLIAVRGDYASLVKNPKELKDAFSNLVGNREAIWLPKASEDSPPQLKYLPMLPVHDAKVAAGYVGYSREIGGRYGIYPASKSAFAKKLGSKRFFRAEIIAGSDAIYFSPDDQLIEKALSTKIGKFPSMAASLPAGSTSASLILAPEALSKLVKASILDSLPAAQESIFRTAVSRQLFPNLDRFGKHPLQAGSLTGNGNWKNVEWQTNAAR